MSNIELKEEAELERLRGRLLTITEEFVSSPVMSDAIYNLYITSYNYNLKQISRIRKQQSKLKGN